MQSDDLRSKSQAEVLEYLPLPCFQKHPAQESCVLSQAVANIQTAGLHQSQTQDPEGQHYLHKQLY